jgi:hypothetical protein
MMALVRMVMRMERTLMRMTVMIISISDDYRADTAKDLGINLASDREGCLAQISAMKAEERLRADLAEATYKAYLDKLKERTQEADMLDLSKIDNNQRGIPSSNSNHELSSTKMGSQKKGKKKKG